MEYLTGRDIQLVMHIQKTDHSVQGMGIWENRAFILYDTGICGVYDLEKRQDVPLAVFPLGSYNDGIPSSDYRNHANSCMFSSTHYQGNPIPLLYVTIGTGIGTDEDGYFYRCAVENIRCSVDSQGKESYMAETLQIITYLPEKIENTVYQTPCWGCPCFLMDPEESGLYIFSARYRTKRGCVPEGKRNRYIITRFALPDAAAGGMVRLKASDIEDQFCVDSDVLFTQGGTIVNGKLYYTFGCPQAGYPLAILVFDIRKKCLCAQMTGFDEAFFQEELECCAPWNGTILFNTNAKGHGSIFRVLEEWG